MYIMCAIFIFQIERSPRTIPGYFMVIIIVNLQLSLRRNLGPLRFNLQQHKKPKKEAISAFNEPRFVNLVRFQTSTKKESTSNVFISFFFLCPT